MTEREELDLMEIDEFLKKTSSEKPKRDNPKIKIISDEQVRPPHRRDDAEEANCDDDEEDNQTKAILETSEKLLNFFKKQFKFGFGKEPSMRIVDLQDRTRYGVEVTRGNYEANVLHMSIIGEEQIDEIKLELAMFANIILKVIYVLFLQTIELTGTLPLNT